MIQWFYNNNIIIIIYINKNIVNNNKNSVIKTLENISSFRDRPFIEKLWGGGECSSCRNFSLLSNSLYEFFLRP